MAGEIQKKCSYYNKGYCKFTRKEGGCRNFHPKNICKKLNCKDKSCEERHPKPCRFDDCCRFQTRCQYNHERQAANHNHSEEVKSLTEEIDTLKREIDNLKTENNTKINNLVKVQLQELEELRSENNVLKLSLQTSREYINVTLVSKDAEI